MERQRAATAVTESEPFALELERLRGVATVVLNEHRDDHGLCVVCGSAWPCTRVQLAEHNLALL
jgi:hypothetical protein